MESFLTADGIVALLTLTGLEIVLGIDNIVVIAVIVGKLPEARRRMAMRLGLFLAMAVRIALLLAISWIMSLTKPLFTLLYTELSGRDLILLLGGLFLIYKSTSHIHHAVEGPEPEDEYKQAGSFGAALTQIVFLDIVFSFDSVITAVGMTDHIPIMIVAIVIAILIMLLFAGKVTATIERHPTLKMLALSFILLIGVLLVADGLGKHIERAYIYFAMAFSLMVEVLNIRAYRSNKAAGKKTPA